LDKIKQAKERPSAPLLEELKEKPGLKEIKMRKLVERNTENIQKDVKDEQNAGSKLVTKEGGPSPVKTKAKFFADIINIESLLIYCGAGQQSLFKDLPTNTDALPDLFDKIKGVLEESKLAEKARIHEDENYGIQRKKGNEQVGIPISKDTIIMSTNRDSSKMVIGGHDLDNKGGSEGFHRGTLTKEEVKKRYPTALKKKL
jgi:hypothetical protein